MATKIIASLVREQGVDFAVVLVNRSALRLGAQAKNELVGKLHAYFPGNQIVLCAQDCDGRAEYWGRADIVRFLSNVMFQQLPWAEYSVAA